MSTCIPCMDSDHRNCRYKNDHDCVCTCPWGRHSMQPAPMSFVQRRDADGFITIELSGPAQPVAEFSAELVEIEGIAGLLVTRDGNTITLHCSNGDWTYRLTAYHPGKLVYRGELVE